MISSRAPGSFQPGALKPTLPAVVVDDGDDVDQRAELHRVVHEMRALAEPEPHHAGANVGRDARRRDQRTPRDAAAERRLVAVAEPQPQPRPQPVRANERDASLVRRVRPVPASDGDAVAVDDEVLDAGAELERNVGVGVHSVGQRRLQVAAMGHPVRRDVARFGIVAERNASEDLAARCTDLDSLRLDRVGNEPLFEAEPGQDARRIGRELDTGASFLERGRLFEHHGAESALSQGKRCGQAANSGSGDDDVA